MSCKRMTAAAVWAILVGVVSLASESVEGQSGKADTTTRTTEAFTPPRTPWGDPDLRGTWDYLSNTPLERPAALGDKAFYTDAELAEKMRPDNNDIRSKDIQRDLAQAYNDFWWNKDYVPNNRTSLIIDPPDGKRPPLTAEAKKRPRGHSGGSSTQDGPITSWLDLSTYTRCISRVMPRLPQGYNSGTLIQQSPGWVMMVYEQLDTRIIPLDGRPHISANIRQWNGDSRGHWEGNTLVIDTTNFTDKQRFMDAPMGNFHLVERYTRVAPNRIEYTATIDDPTTWTRPWTVLIPWQKDDNYQMFEYACHEANYGMEVILTGGQTDLKAAEEAAKKKKK